MAPCRGSATSPAKKTMGYLSDSPRLVTINVLWCEDDLYMTVGWLFIPYYYSEALTSTIDFNFTQRLEGSGFRVVAVSHAVMNTPFLFLHPSAQIQVVDEGSSATSPDTPESGLAKILKQKGECRPQMCLKFTHFKQCNWKLMLTMVLTLHLFHSEAQETPRTTKQVGFNSMLSLSVFLFQVDLCVVSLMCHLRWTKSFRLLCRRCC